MLIPLSSPILLAFLLTPRFSILLSIKICFYLCVSACLSVCMNHGYWYLWTPEEGVRTPGPGLSWMLGTQRQEMFFTSEPCL